MYPICLHILELLIHLFILPKLSLREDKHCDVGWWAVCQALNFIDLLIFFINIVVLISYSVLGWGTWGTVLVLYTGCNADYLSHSRNFDPRRWGIPPCLRGLSRTISLGDWSNFGWSFGRNSSRALVQMKTWGNKAIAILNIRARSLGSRLLPCISFGISLHITCFKIAHTSAITSVAPFHAKRSKESVAKMHELLWVESSK